MHLRLSSRWFRIQSPFLQGYRSASCLWLWFYIHDPCNLRVCIMVAGMVCSFVLPFWPCRVSCSQSHQHCFLLEHHTCLSYSLRPDLSSKLLMQLCRMLAVCSTLVLWHAGGKWRRAFVCADRQCEDSYHEEHYEANDTPASQDQS